MRGKRQSIFACCHSGVFPLASENNNNIQALTYSLGYFLSLKKIFLMWNPNAKDLGFLNSSSIITIYFPFIIWKKKKSHSLILQIVGKSAWFSIFWRIFEGITFFLFSFYNWVLLLLNSWSHSCLSFIKVPNCTFVCKSDLFIFCWFEIEQIPQLEWFNNLSFSPTI